LPFALIGALAIVMRRFWLLPVPLVAGIVLQRLWPGDFEYGLHHGGPAAATWIAFVGGIVALVISLVTRHQPLPERWGLGAAVVLRSPPVLAHGLCHWSPPNPTDRLALSPSLVRALQTRVPKGAVVIGPLPASYRAVAVAPVYVVAAPVTHVAATKANRPYQRADDVTRWLRTGDPSIPRRYGATWAISDGRLYRLPG